MKKRTVTTLVAILATLVLGVGSPASAEAAAVGAYQIGDYQGTRLATVTSTTSRVTMQPAGTGYQRWILDETARSTDIVNADTGRCMSVMVTVPGLDPPIGTDQCFNSTYQHWQIARWSTLHAMIRSYNNPNYCIGVRASGTPVTYSLYFELCRFGDPAQLFRVNAVA